MLDNNPLTGLIEPPDRRDSWRWGTIVSGNPVRVRLDGDSEPSLATPDCLVPVTTGDRVRVHVHNRRATIMGRTGNPPDAAYPAANTIRIDGVDYALSGSVTAPTFSWVNTVNSISYGHLHAPIPYTPPANYTFSWTIQAGRAWTFIANNERFPSGGTHAIRVIQIANVATDRLTRLQWQLVRA